MIEKPKRRAVSWQEYREFLLKKSSLYSLALACWGGAFLILTIAAICLFFGATSHGQPDEPEPAGMFLYGGIFTLASLLLVSKGSRCVKEAYQMERIAPIALHNTVHLLEAATLIRPSDCPSADPRTELLRPTPPEGETPADQLLRAEPENRQDA